jgi:hypothetical protein
LLLAGGVASAQEPARLPALPALDRQPAAADPLWHAPQSTKKLNYHKQAAPMPPAPEPVIRQVQAFAPAKPGGGGLGDQIDYLIQLLPPGPERMFRIRSEVELREQIRQEAREKSPPERAVFPEEKPVTDEKYAARQFAPQVSLVEPGYVNYDRLYFEDLNSERYGWDLGAAQPLVSTGLFFFDLVTLPYHLASRPFDCIQSSAGYCLPGDPVPYLLYPPDTSTTGALGEAAAIIGLIAIFP